MSQNTPAPGATPAAQTPQWTEPYRSYNFKLSVGETVEAHFLECSGIEIDIPTYEYREAGQSQVVHKLPMFPRYGDVTLRYGLTASKGLWEWVMLTAAGTVVRKNVTVTLLDTLGTQPVVFWNLKSAIVTRWKGARLRADTREVAIEEIVLAYETLDRS